VICPGVWINMAWLTCASRSLLEQRPCCRASDGALNEFYWPLADCLLPGAKAEKRSFAAHAGSTSTNDPLRRLAHPSAAKASASWKSRGDLYPPTGEVVYPVLEKLSEPLMSVSCNRAGSAFSTASLHLLAVKKVVQVLDRSGMPKVRSARVAPLRGWHLAVR
jgi:hypothetical protein